MIRTLVHLVVLSAGLLGASDSKALTGATKMSNRQAMECIYGDKTTQSAFQDLQAAYELRKIEAKEFFTTLDTAKNCPQLKKNLQKLRQTTVAQFPTTPVRPSAGASAGSSSASSATPSSTPGAAIFPPDVSGSTGFSGGSYVPPPPPSDFYGPPAGDGYGFPDDDLDY
jgi:hypothetical protein